MTSSSPEGQLLPNSGGMMYLLPNPTPYATASFLLILATDNLRVGSLGCGLKSQANQKKLHRVILIKLLNSGGVGWFLSI